VASAPHPPNIPPTGTAPAPEGEGKGQPVGEAVGRERRLLQCCALLARRQTFGLLPPGPRRWIPPPPPPVVLAATGPIEGKKTCCIPPSFFPPSPLSPIPGWRGASLAPSMHQRGSLSPSKRADFRVGSDGDTRPRQQRSPSSILWSMCRHLGWGPPGIQLRVGSDPTPVLRELLTGDPTAARNPAIAIAKWHQDRERRRGARAGERPHGPGAYGLHPWLIRGCEDRESSLGTQ